MRHPENTTLSASILLNHIRLLRPRHWLKNSFIFAPLFFVPALWPDYGAWLNVCIAALCFCLISSAVYIYNDWSDREADRAHPTKRLRPLAAGYVSEKTAIAAVLVLLFSGLGVATAQGMQLLFVCIAYLLNNLFYNNYFRNKSLLDAASIALGFTLRILAGSVVIDVAPSPFIMICVMLLALFIVFEKRRDDLYKGIDIASRPALRGYNHAFLNVASAVLLASLSAFYMLYVTDQRVIDRLGSPHLYLTVPFVLMGVLRYLQLVHLEKKSGSPVEIMFKDRFLQVSVGGWLLLLAGLIQR